MSVVAEDELDSLLMPAIQVTGLAEVRVAAQGDAPEAGPPIAANQIKPLGVADTKRLADFPDVPTCAELGYPIESGVSSVVVVPAGTPPEIVKAILDAFKSASEDPVLQKFMKKINMNLEYLGPEETATKLAKFRTLYARIIGKLGLKKK